MKDDNGLYYYPFPSNKRVRMYVAKNEDGICFRMWNSDDPEMWENHGWAPYEAIQRAISMYKGKGFDPKLAYDIDIAKSLLRENGKDV